MVLLVVPEKDEAGTLAVVEEFRRLGWLESIIDR